MSYSTEKNLAYTEKNFLCVVEPAKQVTDWTLLGGTVYFSDFSVSDEFIEYVSGITSDGSSLTITTGTPSIGQYKWDYENRKIYINVGGNPSGYFIVVFFELYFSTKTINTNRDPLDINSTVVYFSPRIIDPTIPEIDQNDLLLFGSNSGSLKLINTDSAFYIYDDVSFNNKNIKIFHVLNDITNIKLIYTGKISAYSINDSLVSLSYRQVDFIFNNQINSYLPVANIPSKGFFNKTDFPNLDPNFDGYAIKIIYGQCDDIQPINIDYSETATTTTNRNWVVRSDSANKHQLNSSVLAFPVSTTTRIYIGPHFFRIEDAVKIIISGTPRYSFVSAVGSNYIDISPSLPLAPLSGDSAQRSSIGYVKIKLSTGSILNLCYGRDFTESNFANGSLGITLTNNFEANHSITLFDPKGDSIFVRCYGKKHTSDNDSVTGNLTKASLVLVDIFENYLKLTTEMNKTQIESVAARSISIAIPDQNSTIFPTYREIIADINKSVLGQIFYDQNQKLVYRLIGPMGSSTLTIDDRMLINFGVLFDGADISNQLTVFYYKKENANGSKQISHKRINKFSSIASYLHEVEGSLDLFTYLLHDNEANEIAEHYKIIYEDWQRVYSIELKTQLAESLIGDVVELERDRMIGYNFKSGTLRQKKMIISKLKKGLTSISADCNDQKNIETNLGSW